VSELFKELSPEHIAFINRQHVFFVGTAGAEGFINVSPKGLDSLRVIDATKIVWLNLTGSGNETAAHVRENKRMTLMLCSFEKQPLILRIYGDAKAIHPREPGWREHIDLFPAYTGARQLFELAIRLVQTSCGYAVPYYELKGERPTLSKWADNRGREGVEQYWAEHNVRSLNDKETGIL
jgi:pyridoxamine 5'-phosphate oxidase-like protein